MAGEITDILKKRAEALAESNQPANKKDTIETASFLLRDEIYGIELRFVREILPLGPMTFIPGVPEYISGIINVRGEILSVMDLKRLFNLEAETVPDIQHIMILSAPGMTFGILADQILGVRQIPRETLQSSLPTLTGMRANYLKGLDKTGLIMLDGEKLLTDERLVVNNDSETLQNQS